MARIRYGSIALTHGKTAILDEADFHLVKDWKWRAQQNVKRSSGNWYARGSKKIDGKHVQVFMHRLIVCAPSGVIVDHIDGDSLNNRRNNLRCLPSNQKNIWNSNRRPSKRKYLGVEPKRKKFQAFLSGRMLSSHDTEIDAALAVDKAIIATRDVHTKTNFPRELVVYVLALRDALEALENA